MMISPPPSQFPPFPPHYPPLPPPTHLPTSLILCTVHQQQVTYTPFSVNLDGITGSLKKYSTSILGNSYEERLLDIFKVNRFNHATQSI